MLWKPGHSVHASGGHFFFFISHMQLQCLYMHEYVEPAQKEGSLNMEAELLISDGKTITASNMQNKTNLFSTIAFKYKKGKRRHKI